MNRWDIISIVMIFLCATSISVLIVSTFKITYPTNAAVIGVTGLLSPYFGMLLIKKLLGEPINC